MSVVFAWLRLDVRRRWRSLAVLALLIAIASGTVMTAVAGARRGASAIGRIEARTLPATAAILANTPGFDWAKIRRLPEVETLATFGAQFTIKGLPPAMVAEPVHDPMMRTIEKPVVLSGRIFDYNRVDEAFVSPHFVSHFHKDVGDWLTVVLATPKEVTAHGGSGPNGTFTGPELRVQIVGVGIAPWYSDTLDGKGTVELPPAVVRRYPQNTLGDLTHPETVYEGNALVRLKGGAAAVPQLRADLARVAGRSDIDVWDIAERLVRPGQREATFEASCLLAFGAAAFMAAVFLVGQAIVRYAAASTAELQTLRALGMSPRQAIATASAGPIVAGALGGGLGVLGAIIASRWFPIGVASTAEPTPGTSADWVVFGPGLAAIVLLTAIASATAAGLAVGARARAMKARRSSLATLLARAGLSVPVVVGTRFALEPGRGRTSVPVRPALIGAVIGVLGILAAFTFSQGVADAAGHPERFGQTFHLSAFVGEGDQDFVPTDKLTAALRARPEVAGVDNARVGVATGPDGDSSVTLYSYSTGPKPLPVVVTSGRMPRSADEVLLAPQSLQALHTRVGDRVALSGSKGTATVKVTGAGLVPTGSHNGYADGGWVTSSGYDTLFRGFKFHLSYVSLRPDARTENAGVALTAAIARDPAFRDVAFAPPDPLTELTELRQVRVLPIVLGLFLALLAVGAVGHALATAVRRRSHDLAVLRAVGMTQWQSRGVVVTQASVLALVGLAFGVPLGLAIGRTVWRAVADYTPVQYVPPLAVTAVLLVVPAALLIANALAAWPGHRAARLRIAHVLRTE
jgi:FtsX-like permease family protein